ncbi:MAG: ABC transporter permease [Ilumatobacteraceae bacterium]
MAERRFTASSIRWRMPNLGMILLGLTAAICLLGPFLWKYEATEIGAGLPFLGPMADHPLGTDDLGRDQLARMMIGGRVTVFVALGSTLISLVLGLAWGLAAAARRGWIDEVLMRLADSFMAIPQIVFALVFVAGFGSSMSSVLIVIGVLLSPVTARVVRSVAIKEFSSDYAVAAKASGQTSMRVLLTEVLPNLVPTVLVQATINVSAAIMLEATLSFIGLGIQPPNASWGTLLLQGYGKFYNSAWLVTIPTVWIVITIWSLTSISELHRRRQREGSRA